MDFGLSPAEKTQFRMNLQNEKQVKAFFQELKGTFINTCAKLEQLKKTDPSHAEQADKMLVDLLYQARIYDHLEMIWLENLQQKQYLEELVDILMKGGGKDLLKDLRMKFEKNG